MFWILSCLCLGLFSYAIFVHLKGHACDVCCKSCRSTFPQVQVYDWVWFMYMHEWMEQYSHHGLIVTHPQKLRGRSLNIRPTGLVAYHQAFSQSGVQASSGHPIADCWYIFLVYNAMGWKVTGHPIHPKCVFLDTQFWNPGQSRRLRALNCKSSSMFTRICVHFLFYRQNESECNSRTIT